MTSTQAAAVADFFQNLVTFSYEFPEYEYSRDEEELDGEFLARFGSDERFIACAEALARQGADLPPAARETRDAFRGTVNNLNAAFLLFLDQTIRFSTVGFVQGTVKKSFDELDEPTQNHIVDTMHGVFLTHAIKDLELFSVEPMRIYIVSERLATDQWRREVHQESIARRVRVHDPDQGAPWNQRVSWEMLEAHTRGLDGYSLDVLDRSRVRPGPFPEPPAGLE